MVGIYLSGTGNTAYCLTVFLSLLDEQASSISIEHQEASKAIQENTTIILAYPIQFSNIPYMLRDFIHHNAAYWEGKQIICMATMGAFSGDGAGCCARLLKKYGAVILGGIHIRMPDSVCDVKLLKKPQAENKQIVLAAKQKLMHIAANIKAGNYPNEGLSMAHHIVGLFGQRLWFYHKTQQYSSRLKISDACIGCGTCATSCPMKNITMLAGKAIPGNQCTMCYRCISRCPNKAITLIGKRVYEQCRIEKYLYIATAWMKL